MILKMYINLFSQVTLTFYDVTLFCNRMEQNDTANTEKKPLSVLERFRQLSRQKEQQPEVVDVKAGGEVGVIYLTSDKTTKGNETESEPVVKEMVFNNRGKGFRGKHLFIGFDVFVMLDLRT